MKKEKINKKDHEGGQNRKKTSIEIEDEIILCNLWIWIGFG